MSKSQESASDSCLRTAVSLHAGHAREAARCGSRNKKADDGEGRDGEGEIVCFCLFVVRNREPSISIYYLFGLSLIIISLI